MLYLYWQMAGVTSTMAILAAGPAYAQSSAVSAQEVSELRDQVQALQHKIQQLEGKVAKTDKSSHSSPPTVVVPKAPAPAPTAIVRMSPGNRPSICTPDELNCIAFTSRLHVDVGGYSYHPNTASTVPQRLDSGVNTRRARIGILGTFMGDWN